MSQGDVASRWTERQKKRQAERHREKGASGRGPQFLRELGRWAGPGCWLSTAPEPQPFLCTPQALASLRTLHPCPQGWGAGLPLPHVWHWLTWAGINCVIEAPGPREMDSLASSLACRVCSGWTAIWGDMCSLSTWTPGSSCPVLWSSPVALSLDLVSIGPPLGFVPSSFPPLWDVASVSLMAFCHL